MAEKEHKYTTIHKNGKTIIKDETLKEQKLQYKKERNQKIKFRLSSYSRDTSGLFSAIVLILVSVVLIRVLFAGGNFSSDSISFRSLLDLLKNAPSVSTDFKNFFASFHIYGNDVGVLGFFADFLNIFIDATTIIMWLAGALIDVIIFITYFLKWVFI